MKAARARQRDGRVPGAIRTPARCRHRARRTPWRGSSWRWRGPSDSPISLSANRALLNTVHRLAAGVGSSRPTEMGRSPLQVTRTNSSMSISLSPSMSQLTSLFFVLTGSALHNNVYVFTQLLRLQYQCFVGLQGWSPMCRTIRGLLTGLLVVDGSGSVLARSNRSVTSSRVWLDPCRSWLRGRRSSRALEWPGGRRRRQPEAGSAPERPVENQQGRPLQPPRCWRPACVGAVTGRRRFVQRGALE